MFLENFGMIAQYSRYPVVVKMWTNILCAYNIKLKVVPTRKMFTDVTITWNSGVVICLVLSNKFIVCGAVSVHSLLYLKLVHSRNPIR